MVSNLEILERDGRVWFRDVLNTSDIENLRTACALGNPYGNRISPNSDAAGILHETTNLHNLVGSLLPGGIPVRALVFNKSTDANWVVPWHQDRVIAVKDRHKVAGYKNWTKKSGVWHVEPPEEILENMVFARGL